MGRRRALAVALSVLLVASAVVSSGGVALVAATPGHENENGNGQDHPLGGPPGHNGVPSSNVQVGETGNGQGGGPSGGLPDSVPAHAAAWNVHASEHPGDLEVSIEVTDDGRLRMVLTDDVNHAGREVAVNASALEQALGYLPNEVDGLHESGEEWTSRLVVEDGMATFEVPRFSTNTVTFDGEVSLEGSEATDGATLEYDLVDHTAASDPQGTLTGVEVAEWDNVSAAGLADGDTLDVSPAGHEVRGPANGDPEVVFEGEVSTNSQTESGSASAAGSASISPDGNVDPTGPANGEPELTLTGRADTQDNTQSTSFTDTGSTHDYTNHIYSNPPSSLDQVRATVDPPSSGYYFWLNVSVDGTKVYSDVKEDFGSGTFTYNIDLDESPSSEVEVRIQGYSYPDSGETWTLESSKIWSNPPSGVSASSGSDTVDFGSFSRGETKSKAIDLSNSDSSLDFSSTGEGSLDWSLDYTERTATENPGVDLDGDGTDDVTHSGILMGGETASYAASALSPGDDSATFSTASGSTVRAEVRLEEVVETRDPTVTVNGEVVGSHTGTLADGDTANFTGDAAVLQDGTNTVNISVGDGSLSADAPTPRVGFTYSHAATVDQNVSYSGETWSERYDITREWGDAGENASLTVPFEGNVVAMRDLTIFVNGTETPPAWSRFEENSTTLEVGLGDVNPDTTTRVVANGSKVRVGGDGAIAVREPTVEGDGLDTKVELLSWTNDSYIAVSGTSKHPWIHHTASESWDTPETYVAVDSSDTQTLHLPDAVAGSTTRVRTVPLEVTPESGGVEVVVLDAAVDVDGDGTTDSPRFRIRQGDAAGADTVEVAYHDVQSGETYELYDETNKRGVDTDTAESPVYFTTSGDAVTYVVRLYEASSSDPPPVIRGGEESSSGESPFGSLLVLVGVVVGILAFWAVGRRFTGARGFRDNYLLLSGGGAVALVGVSAVGGGSAWSALERAAGTPAGAILGAVAAMLAIQRVDEWTGWVPTTLKAAAGLGLGFWVVQVLTDGALSQGVEEVAPFLVVLGVIVFAVLAWRALKGPTINIRGDSENRGEQE